MRIGIWDTPGMERSDPVTVKYFRGAHAVIVVYNITQEKSFWKARTWLQRLQYDASPNILKALVGNKTDFVSKREVEYKVICATL